jgi:uncharacterized protein (TIGR02391 family)
MKERTEFSKHKLKNLFLEFLYELRPGGKMDHHTNNVNAIVESWIDEYSKIQLTENERQKLSEGVNELRNANLICQDYKQGPNFVVLTQKGKKLVEDGKEVDLYGVQLQEVVRNDELLSVCLDNFETGKFDTAVFSAFRLVEEKIRKKAELDENHLGVTLVTEALHPEKGLLFIPQCRVKSEQEGIYNLFKGAIAFFKNPISHREVKYEDPLTTIRIIGFAEFLLQIILNAQTKSQFAGKDQKT